MKMSKGNYSCTQQEDYHGKFHLIIKKTNYK